MGRFLNLSGQKFGRLTVIRRAKNNKWGGIQWECKCECGKVKVIRAGHLQSGASQSCGCLSAELAIKRGEIHGMAKSPEYNTWVKMKMRCLNKKDKSYSNYGGRGIKIRNEWMDFKTFIKEMGLKPDSSSEYKKLANAMSGNGFKALENIDNKNYFFNATDASRTQLLALLAKIK